MSCTVTRTCSSVRGPQWGLATPFRGDGERRLSLVILPQLVAVSSLENPKINKRDPLPRKGINISKTCAGKCHFAAGKLFDGILLSHHPQPLLSRSTITVRYKLDSPKWVGRELGVLGDETARGRRSCYLRCGPVTTFRHPPPSPQDCRQMLSDSLFRMCAG